MVLYKPNENKPWAIAVVEKTKDKNLTFNLEGNQIECESKVYLLGATIDFELNFNEHISNICKMASRQLNVLVKI